MRSSRFAAAPVAFVGVVISGVTAQALDCRNPVDQVSMNQCAERDFQAADRGLNAQYQATKRTITASDPDGERLLVAAQKAWIPFRDAHCRSVAQSNKGGSMEPLMWFSCLARTTEARTRELKDLAGDYGN